MSLIELSNLNLICFKNDISFRHLILSNFLTCACFLPNIMPKGFIPYRVLAQRDKLKHLHMTFISIKGFQDQDH